MKWVEGLLFWRYLQIETAISHYLHLTRRFTSPIENWKEELKHNTHSLVLQLTMSPKIFLNPHRKFKMEANNEEMLKKKRSKVTPQITQGI